MKFLLVNKKAEPVVPHDAYYLRVATELEAMIILYQTLQFEPSLPKHIARKVDSKLERLFILKKTIRPDSIHLVLATTEVILKRMNVHYVGIRNQLRKIKLH